MSYLETDDRNHPAVLAMRWTSNLRRLIEQWGLACCWCGRFCNPGLKGGADAYPTREHIIRRADGGSSRMENKRIACRKCNNERHGPNWKPLKAAPGMVNLPVKDPFCMLPKKKHVIRKLNRNRGWPDGDNT